MLLILISKLFLILIHDENEEDLDDSFGNLENKKKDGK
jgi:hypothetical protein